MTRSSLKVLETLKKKGFRHYCQDFFLKSYWHIKQTLRKEGVIEYIVLACITAQKVKFSIKYFFSKCNQICVVSCGFRHSYWRNPQWKTSIFCAVYIRNTGIFSWHQTPRLFFRDYGMFLIQKHCLNNRFAFKNIV